jgi:hypothetical protein
VLVQQATRRSLTPEQVYTVLTSPESATKLSERLPGSRTLFCEIRKGNAYADLFPEIPRKQARKQKSCQDCCFLISGWRSGKSENPCSLGIPEAEKFGANYATDCAIAEDLF